jgi:putative endonuclease
MSKNYVYILECSDETLYTGWTVNIEKRLQEHNSGNYGAKYTKSRRPVKLVHLEMFDSLSGVLKRESQIKKMSRAEKLQLIKQNPERM